MERYLRATFRGISKREIVLWITAAMVLGGLDNLGGLELDRMESARLDVVPTSAAEGLLHFLGACAALLFTFPLVCAKVGVGFSIQCVFGFDLLRCSAGGGAGNAFNFCLDLFLVAFLFAFWRLVKTALDMG